MCTCTCRIRYCTIHTASLGQWQARDFPSFPALFRCLGVSPKFASFVSCWFRCRRRATNCSRQRLVDGTEGREQAECVVLKRNSAGIERQAKTRGCLTSQRRCRCPGQSQRVPCHLRGAGSDSRMPAAALPRCRSSGRRSWTPHAVRWLWQAELAKHANHQAGLALARPLPKTLSKRDRPWPEARDDPAMEKHARLT